MLFATLPLGGRLWANPVEVTVVPRKVSQLSCFWPLGVQGPATKLGHGGVALSSRASRLEALDGLSGLAAPLLHVDVTRPRNGMVCLVLPRDEGVPDAVCSW